MNREDINNIYNLLDNTGSIDQANISLIEDICSKVEGIFIEAGLKSFGESSVFNKKGKIKRKSFKLKKPKKPYFNKLCKSKRHTFLIARKRYRHQNSQHNLHTMKEAGREYKREVKKSYKNHLKSIQKSFITLKKSNNPKEYWNLLNKGKNKNEINCSMQDFYNFFKELNSSENSTDNFSESEQIENELDEFIGEAEILSCISKLKNNKACGVDGISNEYIKETKHIFLPIYCKLFNLIYKSGHMPTIWSIGIIQPIYKNKGDNKVPGNYRPISILSCLGKLFTSILNVRITKYVEYNDILGEEQLGFRQGYSTIDGIFILQSLIEFFMSKNSFLYAAFIDLAKAFPSITRNILFKKLSDINLGKNMLNIIKSMYSDIKSCVYVNGEYSPLFPCQIGLREGENLSPILFSLYINDLYNYIHAHTTGGIVIETVFDDITYYLRLFLIMYADDMVLLSDSKNGLQNILQSFTNYCDINKLHINIDKSKVVIFGKRKKKQTFFINNNELETVDQFKYLGVTISNKGRFMYSIKDNISKARRAHYLQMKHVRNNCIPLSCHIELFKKTIDPILLYGAEIWGFEKYDILEKFRIKCLKSILHLKTSTPDYMVYGELGIMPLACEIKTRMVSYWGHLLMGNPDKINLKMYRKTRELSDINTFRYKWNTCIEMILNEVGFGYIWTLEHPEQEYTHRFSEVIQRIKDQHLQVVNSEYDMSSKKQNYLILKEEHKQAPYFDSLQHTDIMSLLKFRTDNHRLPVETGRYHNICYENRICQICKLEVGDKFHYLFSCPFFSQERNIYIHSKYRINPNIIKYKQLLSHSRPSTLRNLCKFIKIITRTIKT